MITLIGFQLVYLELARIIEVDLIGPVTPGMNEFISYCENEGRLRERLGRRERLNRSVII